MPAIAFYLMSITMKLVDLFTGYSDKNFKTLGLKSGQTVMDYGCGPARYIRNASQAVGPKGKVYAVDIHPLAVKKVLDKARKFGLTNIEALQANNYHVDLAGGTIDVLYALDMFHMVENTQALLTEFARLVKPDGVVLIEDGHQPRKETMEKITAAGLFEIVEETKAHVKCRKENR